VAQPDSEKRRADADRGDDGAADEHADRDRSPRARLHRTEHAAAQLRRHELELKAGVAYRFVVVDRAAGHDFHLTGPGVDKVITGVGFLGTKSVVLKLKKGTYRYVCDPHAGFNEGDFTVA
jgi:plastocyanin